MRHFPHVLLLFVVGTLSVGCVQNPESSGSSADSNQPGPASKIALISITSDPTTDLQEVNMGLTFAGFCVDEGYDTNIFLNVKGVKLATETFSEDIAFKNHSPLKTQLIALAERGVQVHVCPFA